jgi:glycosyltransferase involved in cell wall biosynthesis
VFTIRASANHRITSKTELVHREHDRSMNFLFFPGGSYVGGMEIVVQGLMAQLNATGHRTLAVVSGWNNGDYPTRLKASGLSFEEVKLGRFYRSRPLWTLDTLRNLPGAALRLRRLAKEFRPDAAIYPDTQLLLMGSLIFPRLQNVLYQHNDLSNRRPSAVLKVANARLDHIVCVSDFVAAGMRVTGFAPGKITVVHNGVVLPTAPSPSSHERSTQLGIVGQLLPRKQHLTLVRALGILKARRPSLAFCLKIIGNGDGPYAQAVKALIEQLKLQSIVEWSGFFTNRDDIYRNLDVVVAPAIDEPFGTTILEAGAYGLPVVAARSGGFPEMVVDGTTGLLFDPAELESLVAALEKMIVDPSLRDRLGRAGRAHIGQTFSIEYMAHRFADVLSHAEAH